MKNIFIYTVCLTLSMVTIFNSIFEVSATEYLYDQKGRYDGYTIDTGKGTKLIYDEASRQRGYIYTDERQKDYYQDRNKNRYSNGDSGYSGNSGRSN